MMKIRYRPAFILGNGIGVASGGFREELKFWMIHCFISVAPLIAFRFSLGLKYGLEMGTLGTVTATALFALACALIAVWFGGFAQSRAIFPSALRVILHLRALQVGLFFMLYMAAMLIKPIASLAFFFIIPDFTFGMGAHRIYGRLSEHVTVKGSVILETCHPFLSSFVFTGLLALIWSVVFCALTLPTMIVLNIRGAQRITPASRSAVRRSFPAMWRRRR